MKTKIGKTISKEIAKERVELLKEMSSLAKRLNKLPTKMKSSDDMEYSMILNRVKGIESNIKTMNEELRLVKYLEEFIR